MLDFAKRKLELTEEFNAKQRELNEHQEAVQALSAELLRLKGAYHEVEVLEALEKDSKENSPVKLEKKE